MPRRLAHHIGRVHVLASNRSTCGSRQFQYGQIARNVSSAFSASRMPTESAYVCRAARQHWGWLFPRVRQVDFVDRAVETECDELSNENSGLELDIAGGVGSIGCPELPRRVHRASSGSSIPRRSLRYSERAAGSRVAWKSLQDLLKFNS